MKLQEAVLHITPAELKDAFPEFFTIYKETFGSKRPDITAEAVERYTFSPQIPDPASDYYVSRIWVIMREREVYTFDSNQGGKTPSRFSFNLIPGDAIMEIDYSSRFLGTTLYVHPSFLIKQVSQDPTDNLSIPEVYVLLCFRAYVARARREYFLKPFSYSGNISISNSTFKYNEKSFWQEVKETFPELNDKNEIYDTIVGLLAQDGYIKISSNGNSQLTQRGKNLSEELLYYKW